MEALEAKPGRLRTGSTLRETKAKGRLEWERNRKECGGKVKD